MIKLYVFFFYLLKKYIINNQIEHTKFVFNYYSFYELPARGKEFQINKLKIQLVEYKS